jgi:hypothetical protein
MIRFAALVLILVFAAVWSSSGVEADLKREAPVAASSNILADPRPQLAPNTNAGPEVPIAAETAQPATRSEPQAAAAAPVAAQRRKTQWMVLAVLAVVAASYGLQRLRSRSDPS